MAARRDDLRREISALHKALLDDPVAAEREAIGATLEATTAELHRLDATHVDAGPVQLGVNVAGWEAAAKSALALHEALPCAAARRAIETAANADAERSGVLAGSAACLAAGAHAGCVFKSAPWCPELRAGVMFDEIATSITNGRIERREATLLRLHFRRGAGRVPLRPHDATNVAQAIAARRPAKISPGAGNDAVLVAPVALRGNETIAVFYGPTGVGKTLAACYLVARFGGVYLTMPDLAGVGQDPSLPTRAQLRAAKVLVIDQVGREHAVSEHSAAMLEWIMDKRYAAEELTVLVGNFASPREFEDRYDGDGSDGQGVIGDRMRGGGVYVALRGKSLR